MIPTLGNMRIVALALKTIPFLRFDFQSQQVFAEQFAPGHNALVRGIVVG